MTSLVKDRPGDPLDFLINRLTKPEKKRIIIVTPPGMKGAGGEYGLENEQQYNVALMLEQHLKEELKLNIEAISVGDLLERQVVMHSDMGQKIMECRKLNQQIPDEIVIDLVKKLIERNENDENQGWILEGFPRNRLQALALQNMKIIPDKFFMLKSAD